MEIGHEKLAACAVITVLIEKHDELLLRQLCCSNDVIFFSLHYVEHYTPIAISSFQLHR